MIAQYPKCPTPKAWAALLDDDAPCSGLVSVMTLDRAVRHVGTSLAFLAVPAFKHAIGRSSDVALRFLQGGNLVFCPALTVQSLIPAWRRSGAAPVVDFMDCARSQLSVSKYVIVPSVCGWWLTTDVWNVVVAHLRAGRPVIFLTEHAQTVPEFQNKLGGSCDA